MRKLSAIEMRFAEEVVKNGGDKLQAYKVAGYSQNMTPTKQSIQADKVYNRPKVNLKIEELQKIADSVAVERFSISVEERLRRLDHLYKCGTEEVITPQGLKQYQGLSVAAKSIEVMNSMLGIDEKGEVKPVKVNIGIVDAS